MPADWDHPYAALPAGHSNASLSAVGDDEVIETYKQCGAILFRNFSLDTRSLRRFADRFCRGSILNDTFGREVIDRDNDIQSVNLGSAPVPLHPELSIVPWKPDVCFFACLTPPASGGETTICDGTASVENMSRELFGALTPRKLLYAKVASPEECALWLGTRTPSDAELENPPKSCPFRFARSEAGIVRFFVVPALHKPMFCDKLAFGNFLLFGRYAQRKLDFPMFANGELLPQDLVDAVRDIGESLTAPIKWRKNDVVMLDNTPFMHGRNRVLDTNQRLIISVFGYLEFARVSAEEIQHAPWRQSGFVAPHH